MTVIGTDEDAYAEKDRIVALNAPKRWHYYTFGNPIILETYLNHAPAQGPGEVSAWAHGNEIAVLVYL